MSEATMPEWETWLRSFAPPASYPLAILAELDRLRKVRDAGVAFQKLRAGRFVEPSDWHAAMEAHKAALDEYEQTKGAES